MAPRRPTEVDIVGSVGDLQTMCDPYGVSVHVAANAAVAAAELVLDASAGHVPGSGKMRSMIFTDVGDSARKFSVSCPREAMLSDQLGPNGNGVRLNACA